MSRAGVLLGAVLGLVVCAGTALELWGVAGSRASARKEFQHLTGGLGFGPAVSPEGCEFGFDPRLCPACPHDSGPIPGGMVFCPYHGCSIFAYPPLSPEP